MDSSPISTNIHSSTQRTAGEFADLIRPILPDVTNTQIDQLLQYSTLAKKPTGTEAASGAGAGR